MGLTYRSEVDLDFKDVASLSNIGPVLQGLLNLSGVAGKKVDIDMDVTAGGDAERLPPVDRPLGPGG